jgi:hypothetical protein
LLLVLDFFGPAIVVKPPLSLLHRVGGTFQPGFNPHLGKFSHRSSRKAAHFSSSASFDEFICLMGLVDRAGSADHGGKAGILELTAFCGIDHHVTAVVAGQAGGPRLLRFPVGFLAEAGNIRKRTSMSIRQDGERSPACRAGHGPDECLVPQCQSSAAFSPGKVRMSVTNSQSAAVML